MDYMTHGEEDAAISTILRHVVKKMPQKAEAKQAPVRKRLWQAKGAAWKGSVHAGLCKWVPAVRMRITYEILEDNFMGKAFLLTIGVFCLQWSFFAYSPLRCFLDTLSHRKPKSSNCKQKSTNCKQKTQAVSKKAPKHNCKQKSSAVSRELPIGSKKAAS